MTMDHKQQPKADPIKMLAQMVKAYEAAQEPCKGSLGLFLRSAYADVQAKRMEYRTKKVG